MSRSSTQRLKILLKLEALREQRAARVLGELGQRVATVQRDMGQLQNYQHEYAEHLRQVARSGIEPAMLRNHDRFVLSLERAHQHQQQVLATAEAQREQARMDWTTTHARRRLLEQLAERRRREESDRAEQRLQRELDDRHPCGDESGRFFNIDQT